MLFDAPIPFAEAIRYAAGKQLLPTTLTSAELRTLRRELRRRSVFSAQVTDGGFLQEFNDLVEAIAGGPDDADFAARLAGERPLLMSIPDAKARLGDYLEQIGYEPEPGAEGTIKDLMSNARRQLIVETNVLDTMGYGRWAAGQNAATLDQFPALELVRMRFSKVPRDWEERWDDARAETEEEGATAADSGRLVALVNHPIWLALGDGAGGYTDTLGNPWPPFAFNSGMGVLDVSREDAIALGICDEHTVVAPQPVNRLNESTQASVANWNEELKKQLAQGGFKIIDNGKTITMANCEVDAVRARIGALLDGIEAVMFANNGTTAGALKGWETRRGGRVFFGADKGGYGRPWSDTSKQTFYQARAAIERAIDTRSDVPNAFKLNGKTIDLKWGSEGTEARKFEDGSGMAKILNKHGETAARRIAAVLARGTPLPPNGNTQVFVHHGWRVAITKTEGRDPNHWVLTSYHPGIEKAKGNR